MVKIKEEIKKNGEKVYRANVYLGIDSITKAQRQTVVRGRTKKEVKDKIILKKNEFMENGNTTVQRIRNGSEMTFEEVYQEWREKHYENNVAESTLQSTLNIFRLHILPAVGHIKINKLDVTHCQKMVDYLMGMEYTNTKKAVNYGARVCDYALNQGFSTQNPFRLVQLPRKTWTIKQMKEEQEKEQSKFYTLDEVKLFLECARKETTESNTLRWYAFFALLFTSGLRFGEVTALTWNDIDSSRNTLSVNRAYSKGLGYRPILKTPKTRSSVRDIYLPDDVIQLLIAWKKEQERDYHDREVKFSDETLLFPNRSNKNLAQSTVRNKLNSFLKKYNLKKITPHGFRHTYSTLLYQANTGEKAKERQRLLGHSNMDMTNNTYTHSTFEEERKVVENFENLIKLQQS